MLSRLDSIINNIHDMTRFDTSIAPKFSGTRAQRFCSTIRGYKNACQGLRETVVSQVEVVVR